MRIYTLALTVLSTALLLTTTACNKIESSKEKGTVSLQAMAEKQISNDEITAILFVEKNAPNAKSLQQEVAKLTQAGANKGKAYPEVKLSLRYQNTTPIYNSANRITGWNARSELEIKSTNLEQASDLINELQNSMQLSNVTFGLSDSKRKAVEAELIEDVSQQFQNRADALNKVWHAHGYELVDINIRTNSQGEPELFTADKYAETATTADMAAASAVEAVPPVASPYTQSGESTLRVWASGQIQLKQ